MNRPQYQLNAIVAKFGGHVVGEGAALITQVATLEKAQAGQLTFLANNRYRAQLAATRATAIIVRSEDAELTSLPRIVCRDPYVYFAKVSAFLNPTKPIVSAGVHASAVIGEGAHIDPTAHIGPHVSIGADAKIGAGCVVMAGCSIGADTVLGADSILYPRVVVYHNCVLGQRLIAHSGVVIGADGFGIAPEAGRWLNSANRPRDYWRRCGDRRKYHH